MFKSSPLKFNLATRETLQVGLLLLTGALVFPLLGLDDNIEAALSLDFDVEKVLFLVGAPMIGGFLLILLKRLFPNHAVRLNLSQRRLYDSGGREVRPPSGSKFEVVETVSTVYKRKNVFRQITCIQLVTDNGEKLLLDTQENPTPLQNLRARILAGALGLRCSIAVPDERVKRSDNAEFLEEERKELLDGLLSQEEFDEIETDTLRKIRPVLREVGLTPDDLSSEELAEIDLAMLHEEGFRLVTQDEPRGLHPAR